VTKTKTKIKTADKTLVEFLSELREFNHIALCSRYKLCAAANVKAYPLYGVNLVSDYKRICPWNYLLTHLRT